MITSFDLDNISKLILKTSLSGKVNALEEKLSSKQIMSSEKIPESVVTMNSEVSIHDLTVNETLTLKLVYQHSPLYGNQVSVLAPLGTALLGAKLNETLSYELRDGSRREIRISKIHYQPEANGHYHL